MPRIRGRSYRQATPQRAVDRQTQVRERLTAGDTDPAVIAKALGISKEAVLYHARKMDDVVLAYDRTNRRRISMSLEPAENATVAA